MHVVDGRRTFHHSGISFSLRGILLAGTVEATVDTALFALLLACGAYDLHIADGKRRIA